MLATQPIQAAVAATAGPMAAVETSSTYCISNLERTHGQEVLDRTTDSAQDSASTTESRL